MDFGKLSDISQVDFALPADRASNIRRLGGQPCAGSKIYVGAPIWSQKEWVGSVYPLDAKPEDFLRHYTRQFNSIELNLTHYRVPDARTIDAWKKASAPGFKFSPKFPQVISHERALQGCAPMTAAFCDAILGLEDNLGMAFLQLPPTFSPSMLPVMSRFMETLPADFKLAVEFRHPAWFSKGMLLTDAIRLLDRHRMTALITDVAGRRDVLHMDLTSHAAMIRFVGNSLHPTDYSRIDAWVERLHRWLASGLEELYFFIHEPDNVLAPELIQYFIKKLNMKCGPLVEPWSKMDQGSQLGLFG